MSILSSEKCFVFNLVWNFFIEVLVPKRQILDTYKLKEFADDNFRFDENGRKFSKPVENTVEKGEIAVNKQFLIFSSTGRRPASLCHGLLSVMRLCVRLSVRGLTLSLNIFFSETIYQILMKFHRNVPAMVLFRIS